MKDEITKQWILSGKTGSNVIRRLMNNMEVNSNTGCWEVQRNIDRSGYGKIKIKGRNLGSHKISYILHCGDYDQGKFEILHSCDNPRCINPNHLSHGTHKENMHDCIKKGRHTAFKGFSSVVDKYGPMIYIQSPRQMAIALGESTYHGKACAKHNISIRMTSNGECACCKNEYKNKTRITNNRINARCPFVIAE